MDKELRHGTMEPLNILGNSSKERKTARVDLNGKMEATMKVTSLMVSFKVLESIILQILINSTKVNSECLTWRVVELSSGAMVVDTREILRMEKRMVRVHLNGPTAISTLEAGRMGNSMESEYGPVARTTRRGRVNGSTVKDRGGSRVLNFSHTLHNQQLAKSDINFIDRKKGIYIVRTES